MDKRLKAALLSVTLLLSQVAIVPDADARRGASAGRSRSAPRSTNRSNNDSGSSSGGSSTNNTRRTNRNTQRTTPTNPTRSNTTPPNVRTGGTAGFSRSTPPATITAPTTPTTSTSPSATPRTTPPPTVRQASPPPSPAPSVAPSATPKAQTSPPPASANTRPSTPSHRSSRPVFFDLDLEFGDDDDNNQAPVYNNPSNPQGPSSPAGGNVNAAQAGEVGLFTFLIRAFMILSLVTIAGLAIYILYLAISRKISEQECSAAYGFDPLDPFLTTANDLSDDKGSIVVATVAVSRQYPEFESMLGSHWDSFNNAEEFVEAFNYAQSLALQLMRVSHLLEYGSVQLVANVDEATAEAEYKRALVKAESRFQKTVERRFNGEDINTDNPFVFEEERPEGLGDYYAVTFIIQSDYNRPVFNQKPNTAEEMKSALEWIASTPPSTVETCHLVIDPAGGDKPITQGELLTDYPTLRKLL